MDIFPTVEMSGVFISCIAFKVLTLDAEPRYLSAFWGRKSIRVMVCGKLHIPKVTSGRRQFLILFLSCITITQLGSDKILL